MMGAKVAKGSSWLVITQVVSRLVDIATVFILARLLTPEDFGLVAIATAIILVVDALIGLHVSEALIQVENPTPAQYDTAFTLSLLRGVVVAALIALLSWPVAATYQDDRLLMIVVALAASPLARGLVSPRLAHYARGLSFWRDFVIGVSGKLAALVVGISFAVTTRSYWSLVASTVCFPVVLATASYVVAPYRPKLTLSGWRSFSSFLGWMSASQAIDALNFQSDRLLVGRILGSVQLGVYAVGSNLAALLNQILITSMLKVLLSTFSTIRNDRNRLRHSYAILQQSIVTFSLAPIIGLAMLAEPAIVMVLGERWLVATPIVQGLAFAAALEVWTIAATPLALSLGRTKKLLNRSVLNLLVRVPILCVGAFLYGLPGVVAGRILSTAIMAAVNMYMVKTLVGLSNSDQVLAPWRAVASTALMATIVFLLSPDDFGTDISLTFIESLAIVVCSGAVTYIATIYTLWFISGKPDGLENRTLGLLRKPLSRARRAWR